MSMYVCVRISSSSCSVDLERGISFDFFFFLFSFLALFLLYSHCLMGGAPGEGVFFFPLVYERLPNTFAPSISPKLL